MRLIRTMHITTQQAGDKSLSKGSTVINEFSAILRLPSDVINASRELFGRIVKKKKLKGPKSQWWQRCYM